MIRVAELLHSSNVKKCPNAYESTLSVVSTPNRLVPSRELESVSIPVLTMKTIDKYSKDKYGRWKTAIISPTAAKRVSIYIYKSSDIATVPNIADRYP